MDRPNNDVSTNPRNHWLRWAAVGFVAVLAGVAVTYTFTGGLPGLTDRASGEHGPGADNTGLADDARSPQHADEARSGTTVVEVSPVATVGPEGDAPAVRLLVLGREWVDGPHELEANVSTEIPVTRAAIGDTLGFLFYGDGYRTEAAMLKVSDDRNRCEVALRRAATLRISARIGALSAPRESEDGSSAVRETPAGAETPPPDSLECFVRYSTSGLFELAAADVQQLVDNDELQGVSFLRRPGLHQELPRRAPVALTYNNDSGRYTGEIELPESQAVEVEVSADGYGRERVSVTALFPESTCKIQLRPATTLRVRVVRGNDKPVPTAYIFVEEEASHGEWRQLGAGHADSKGEWATSLPPDKPIRVVAYTDHGTTGSLVTLSEGANELRLSVDEDGNRFVGSIVDDEYVPVRNLWFNLEWQGSSGMSRCRTDDAGRFETVLPEFVEAVSFEFGISESTFRVKSYFTKESVKSAESGTYPADSPPVEIVLLRKDEDELPGTLVVNFQWERKPAKNTLALEGDYYSESNLFPGALMARSVHGIYPPINGDEVSLSPGFYRLRAVERSIANGRFLASPYIEFWVHGSQTVRQTFHLKEATRMRVRLRDESGGIPPSGTVVLIDGVESELVRTNGAGVADCGLHCPGRHTVSVLGGEYYAGPDNEMPVSLSGGSIIRVDLIEAPFQVELTDDGPGDVRFQLQPIARYSTIKPEETDSGTLGFRGVRICTCHLQAFDKSTGRLLTGHRLDVTSYSQVFRLRYTPDGKFEMN